MAIVRAYLEIEELRLGSKLRSEIEVDDEVLQAEVPVLSIQPLVENAVKHGVAAGQTPGFVRIRIRRHAGVIGVEISNSGMFRGSVAAPGDAQNLRTGVGLANVRRRLALYYGDDYGVDIASHDNVTTVRFSIPALRDSHVRLPAYSSR
jgi:sensor histidine kinase YesM